MDEVCWWKKSPRLLTSACGWEIYAAFRGFSIWSDGAGWWCCWAKEEGVEMRPLSLARSLAVRYSSWQAKICFLPPFRPSTFGGGSTIASSPPSSKKMIMALKWKFVQESIRLHFYLGHVFAPLPSHFLHPLLLSITATVIEFQCRRVPYPHLSQSNLYQHSACQNGRISGPKLFCPNLRPHG